MGVKKPKRKTNYEPNDSEQRGSKNFGQEKYFQTTIEERYQMKGLDEYTQEL